ncbi:FAD binding domain-containing protein [Nocardioides pacificus]
MDLGTVTSLRPARSRADLVLAPGETLLAGGTWLFSEPQPLTTGLVDLTALGWPAWEHVGAGEGRRLRVAATCTIEQLLAVPPVVLGPASRIVRECAEALLMSFKVQHTATVGGNLCLALPAGSMISLMTALDAEVVVWTPHGGERREPVATFVTGPGRTTLAPGEVLRAVDVPAASLDPRRTLRTAFRKIALSPIGRSSAVVTGRLTSRGDIHLVVTASTERPLRLADPGLRPGQSLEAVLAELLSTVDCWFDDPHGPRDWRRAVTATLAVEVCEELLGTRTGRTS